MTSNTSHSDQLDNVENIYQLSPMQQGMLFHSLYSPGTGTYFEQSLFTIKGDFDVSAFEQAWQSVVDRHPILRTSFLWEDLEKPLQVVHRRLTLQIDNEDWRELERDEQEQKFASFVAEDRRRGFDLGDAPLMRLALIRFTDDEYKFLFSRHHILLDRWSRAIVLNDFMAFYEALTGGEQPPQTVSRPYRDYIAWLITEQEKGNAEEFWRASLAGFTAPTGFAVDRPVDPSCTGVSAYADLRTQLSEVATEKLESFARQHRLTLNTLAQGAWALLLSHYNGDDDVLFGVTVSGRPATLPGVESMVGLFINTLPLRVATPARSSVLSWLRDLQEQQVAMQQYEYSSLIDIQGWSEVPRGVPLFESIFVFENLPAGEVHESRGLEIHADRGLGSTTAYPLTVLVSPGRQMTVQIVYEQARFAPAAIQRMLGHFQTLLQNLPDHSGAAISSLPLLTPAEREQIVHQWNDTQAVNGVDSVLTLFEAQAARTPDATAVVFESQQLSYRELNARANQLGRHLQGLGVGVDDRVAICIDRSLEMAVAVLGALKAGAAYVPMDPAYPSERLTFMLEDSRCKVVLTSARLAETQPAGNCVLRVDKEWDRVASESAENPQTQIDGGNLAYVIYTSGSTGWPKGVALPHRALANVICWQLDQSSTAMRTLQFASLSFDVSFQEMFSTWCSGGTLLLVSEELRRDAPALLRFLGTQKVERIFLPFVYLQHLAEAFSDHGVPLEHLREIITAGEQLEITPQIVNFCNSLNDLTLHNHYGPSESHVVTAYTLKGKPADWLKLPPIGRPIANTQIYVLDQIGQPTPIGVAGELCIGGANLARGYLNRPDLTAEKFISNPFGDDAAGSRLYRTGDAARFTGDGNIEFLGRLDSQIKIRGFRIELGEIEATLAAHPSVREAVVVVHNDAGDRRLLAYVIPTVQESVELATELRRFLKTKLPDYMAPSDFVFLEELPQTPSGKVNRRALPAPDSSANEQRHSYEPPRTDVEKHLAEIWSAVLKRDRIGIDDNFFELGGHSLLATQLISRVRSVFDLELPLRYLFDFPTVAGLAVGIEEFDKKTATRRPAAITRDTDRETEDLLANIDQLTDEQVEALLNETLTERR